MLGMFCFWMLRMFLMFLYLKMFLMFLDVGDILGTGLGFF